MFRLIFIISILISTNSYAANYSGKIGIDKKFDKFSLNFDTDYRYNDTGLYYRHYDAGIKIPFKKDWSSSINFRSTYQYKNGKWRLEKRPHIQLNKKFNMELIKISIRTRQEYRYENNDTESTRNRSKLLLKSRKTILGVTPFIGNEWFYDMDVNKYNKNWFSTGVELSRTQHSKYIIYYRHLTTLEEQGNWTSSYSLVFKYVYSF